MKKFFIVIANYKDQRQEIFDKVYSPRNQEYCTKHEYEYIVSKGIELFRGNPTWWKFTVPLDLINQGIIKSGDVVQHHDADMIIHKTDIEYPHAKNFTYAIDNGNSHCMGNYSMVINDWSMQLMHNILNETLFHECQHTELWQLWREQAAWYTLSGVPRHSWVDFRLMPHKGWHQTNDPFFIPRVKYSLNELYNNVEILNPEWNSTILAEDRGTIPDGIYQYFIAKSKKEHCIVRHFAAGQVWRTDY